MTISKLIAELEEFKDKHGNIKIFTHQTDCFMSTEYFEELTSKDLDCHVIPESKSKEVLIIY